VEGRTRTLLGNFILKGITWEESTLGRTAFLPTSINSMLKLEFLIRDLTTSYSWQSKSKRLKKAKKIEIISFFETVFLF